MCHGDSTGRPVAGPALRASPEVPEAQGAPKVFPSPGIAPRITPSLTYLFSTAPIRLPTRTNYARDCDCDIRAEHFLPNPEESSNPCPGPPKGTGNGRRTR